MFRTNEPEFPFNDISETPCEESHDYNDVSYPNLSLISPCSSIHLIDDEENKSDANTNNPATQQLVTSNTKLQKGVRELLSLFDFSDDYYRSSSSSHMLINHFNRRSTEQEKQILINYQIRGFDAEDMMYLESSFHS